MKQITEDEYDDAFNTFLGLPENEYKDTGGGFGAYMAYVTNMRAKFDKQMTEQGIDVSEFADPVEN